MRVAIEQRKKREPQGWGACISDHVALSSYVAKATIDTEREGGVEMSVAEEDGGVSIK